MPTNQFPQLTIRITPIQEGVYSAQPLYQQPGSANSYDAGSGQETRFEINPEALTGNMPGDEYGRRLAEMVFQSEGLRAAVEQSRRLAQSANLPLRLRLEISPAARPLQSLDWETLVDPVSKSPYMLDENIQFSRLVRPRNFRPPRLPTRRELSALVVIANPKNLKDYNLPPLDVQDDLRRILSALPGIKVASLIDQVTAIKDSPGLESQILSLSSFEGEVSLMTSVVTLDEISGQMRQHSPDLLYLMAHGRQVDGESILFLSEENGRGRAVKGMEIVSRLHNLKKPPVVTILAVPESAPLALQLVEGSVPAAIGMQSTTEMDTLSNFMPVFLGELIENGRVDQAAAAGRAVVRSQPDWWMPVLFTSLEDALIFEDTEEKTTSGISSNTTSPLLRNDNNTDLPMEIFSNRIAKLTGMFTISNPWVSRGERLHLEEEYQSAISKLGQPSASIRVKTVDSLTGFIRADFVSLDPPVPPQAWIVVANPNQYDWEANFETAATSTTPVTVDWTRARSGLAQRHIAESRPGDLVLAYTSSAQKRAIIGIGQVTIPPFTRDGFQAVNIELLRRFSGEVALDDLRNKLPELEKVRNQRISYSGVAREQWSGLRQLLIQTDASLESLLPDEITEPAPSVKLLLTPAGFPTSLALGAPFSGGLEVRNTGKNSLAPDQYPDLKLAAEWYPLGTDQDEEPAFVDERPWTLSEPLPPGATQEWTDLAYSAPQQTGSYEIIFTLKDPGGKLEAVSIVASVAVLEADDDIKRRVTNLRQSLRRAKPAPPAAIQDRVGETIRQTRQALEKKDLEAAEKGISQAETEWQSWRQESGARQELAKRLQLLGERTGELPETLRRPFTEQVDVWRKAVSALEPLSNIEENTKNLSALLDDLKAVSALLTGAANELEQANKPRSAQEIGEKYTARSLRLIGEPYSHAAFEKLQAELQDDLDAARREAPEPAAPAQGQPPTAEGSDEQGKTTGPPAQIRVYQQPGFALFAPPQPPDLSQRLTIEIGSEDIRLRYQDEEFRSPAERLKTDLELADPFQFSPLQYGKRLFDALILDKPLAGYGSTNEGYILARPDKRQQAFEIRISPNSPFAGYIWEYLADARQTPLAVYEASPFYRLYGAKPTPAEQEKWRIKSRPLKILFAICSPSDLHPLDAGGALGPPGGMANPTSNDIAQIVRSLPALDRVLEANIINNAMEKLVKAGLAQFTMLGDPQDKEPVSWERISQAVIDEGAHVLHILAHGVINPRKRSNPFALVMEKGADRRYDLVYNSSFSKNWVENSQLRLVLAAACDSGSPELRRNLQQDLASQLLEAGVPAVIAMQARIDEHTAQILTRRFYDDLARLGHIEMALAAARTAIYQDDPQNRAWGFPLLIMRQDVGELLDADPEALRKLNRPSDAEIRQEVKPRQALTERAVPAEALAEQALQDMLRSLGVYAQPALLRQAGDTFANQLSGRAPVGQPLAEKQDLAALSDLLSPAVDLRSWELQEYIEGHTGLELPEAAYAQISAGLNAGKHIILIGAHGTAKTTLARAVCEFASGWRLQPGEAPVNPAFGEPGRVMAGKRYTNSYVLSTATADWTTFDTIGGYMPDENQNLQFHPGLFLEAIRQGQWLIVDEINRAEIDKAIGPLFTVLSGQEVALPYKVSSKDVHILPPTELPPGARYDRRNWIPDGAGQDGFDYVIHPNWRIIGTMNIYDKSSLFQLSFAFMRRFAFVDVDPPADAQYFGLVEHWIDEFIRQPALAIQPPAPGQAEPDYRPLRDHFERLIWVETNPALNTSQQPAQLENPVMTRRTIGPAIIRDMLSYIGQRLLDSLTRPPLAAHPVAAPVEAENASEPEILPANAGTQNEASAVESAADPQADELAGFFAEAFSVYIVPQLDGLDYEGIREVYWHVNDVLFAGNPLKDDILQRIRVLYPHIRSWQKSPGE